MRKTLAPLIALVAVSWLTVGCSSSGSGNNGTGGSGPNSGTGGGNSGSGGTTGGGTGGGSSANCIVPKTWTDNLESLGTMCVACAQANCCDGIKACAADQDCLKIYKCEQDCYSGIGPDGSVVGEDDAGTDDAGNTMMDKCVMDCIAAGTTAAQTLFGTQDDCVNGLIPAATTCGKKEICD